MAKVTTQKCNFTAGELSPDLETRTDLQQYANGARTLLNVLPVIEGGVKRRPGAKSVMLAYNTTARRLIPFIVTQDKSFIVEFGDLYLRVFDRTGNVLYTFATLWAGQAITSLQYVQQHFIMWIVDGVNPVKWLRCSADYTTWSLADFPIDVAPFDEVNPTPTIDCTPSAATPAGGPITLTLASAGWSLADVGKYVTINTGLVKITGYTSPTVVAGTIVTVLSSTVLAVANSWTLKESVWTTALGYPRAITYFNQRLILAGTATYPSMIWASRIGDEHNFQLTTLDADAFAIQASSDQNNPILFLAQLRGIVALTSGSEFRVYSDTVFTPTTVQAKEYTTHGCSDGVRPQRVGDELLFVQRGGLRVRALSYRYEIDGLITPDVSALVTHIARDHNGVKGMCYQQEPDSIVWVVLGDGHVASLTLDRDQQVIAWAPHDFGGSVISMMSIPSLYGSDDVFLLVSRGASICIEKLDPSMRVDGAVVGTSTADTITTTTGDMTALIGQSVAACWGNRVVDVVSVAAGHITLQSSLVDDGGSVQVGFPFSSRVTLFPPELAQAPSTSMQNKAKVDRYTLVLKDTLGIEFENGDIIDLQTHDDLLLGVDPTLFTGRHTTEALGWSDMAEMNISIEQNKPLPFHLLSIITDISANER